MKKILIFFAFVLIFVKVAQAQILANETVTNIKERIRSAQNLLNHVEKRTDIELFVAISKSMPRSSLEKLAHDAALSEVTLVLQGVGEKPDDFNQKKSTTALQTYGRHWLARHINEWTFVTQSGAHLQIDPKRFQTYRIADVPQVILSFGHQSKENSARQPHRVFRARGDVTLAYALEVLQKELDLDRQQIPPELYEKANAMLLERLSKLHGA